MPKLRSLPFPVASTPMRTVALPPKVKHPAYTTHAYLQWRDMVVQRAGGRCEAVDPQGHRCIRATPQWKVYADHIVELTDAGSLTDPQNGQCLCRSHHELKTVAARARRLQENILPSSGGTPKIG